MSENEQRSGLHIHLGGLIILIIIILLLFKVDIESKIDSPRFQQNVSFIKNQGKVIWDKYLAEPLTRGWNGLFNNLIDKGVEQIKSGVLNTKVPNINEINTSGATNTYNNFTNNQ